jgi:3-oxoacyl-[acyl-carrier protein] reductase
MRRRVLPGHGSIRPVREPNLRGRVAIVTGANQGIGAACAEALAAEGASVLLTYLRMATPDGEHPAAYGVARASTADEVVARIRAAGGVAEAIEAELSDPTVPRRLFDHAEAAFGPVEILVNNASAWLADTFAPGTRDSFGRPLRKGLVDAAAFDHQFAVDARAAALLIAEFADRHRARGAGWGRIVGLTSSGTRGFPGEVSYGAAKAALESYTLSAALELARDGITANLVHPPVTDTGWITDEVAAAVPRVALPSDVAEVVVLLASDLARHVTGQVVRMS